MADLIRALRGAFPGPGIEPDAGLRAQLALLGHVGVRYGGYGDSPSSGGGGSSTFGQWDFTTAAQSGELLTAGF